MLVLVLVLVLLLLLLLMDCRSRCGSCRCSVQRLIERPLGTHAAGSGTVRRDDLLPPLDGAHGDFVQIQVRVARCQAVRPTTPTAGLEDVCHQLLVEREGGRRDRAKLPRLLPTYELIHLRLEVGNLLLQPVLFRFHGLGLLLPPPHAPCQLQHPQLVTSLRRQGVPYCVGGLQMFVHLAFECVDLLLGLFNGLSSISRRRPIPRRVGQIVHGGAGGCGAGCPPCAELFLEVGSQGIELPLAWVLHRPRGGSRMLRR